MAQSLVFTPHQQSHCRDKIALFRPRHESLHYNRVSVDKHRNKCGRSAFTFLCCRSTAVVFKLRSAAISQSKQLSSLLYPPLPTRASSFLNCPLPFLPFTFPPLFHTDPQQHKSEWENVGKRGTDRVARRGICFITAQTKQGNSSHHRHGVFPAIPRGAPSPVAVTAAVQTLAFTLLKPKSLCSLLLYHEAQ